jgi:hypothetical protein
MTEYGVPDHLDLSPLEGETIERISIGPEKWMFTVDFSNGWFFVCKGADMEVDIGDGPKSWFGIDDPEITSLSPDLLDMPKIMNIKIDTWGVESNKAFFLTLESGPVLKFIVDGTWETLSIHISPPHKWPRYIM